MNDDSDPQALVDQKEALDVYFRALLREPETAADEPVAEAPAPVTEPPVEAPATETSTEAPAAEAQAPVTGPGPIVPDWGEGTFQAMLFKVAGLTLAVPLVELNGVREWSAEAVTPMPGHAPWYLGLMEYREHSVPVVDTAHLVLPEERLARLTSSADERVQRVVFIDEGRWGLACDEVEEVITLAPDQVRWRTSRTRRRWLAGTVVDHMCALLDPPAFADVLRTGLQDAAGAGQGDDDGVGVPD